MSVSVPRLLHGIGFFLFLLSGAVIGFLLLVPWAPLGLIPNKSVLFFRRGIVSSINKLFFLYALFLLKHYAGIKIKVHSESSSFQFDDNIFVICNHRTRVDWMFSAWAYAAYLKIYPFFALVLKDDLKNVPFYGWCMQTMMYMFLSRKKDNDLPHMRRCFEYYRWMMPAVPSSLFIFPEGTDLHPAAIARSDEFAKDKQLPKLHYVLYPRPAGFQLCLSEARRRKAVLHDLTIAYVDHIQGKRTSEVDFLLGTFPKEVHLFVHRLPVADIPTEEAAERNWLIRCFQQKESLLQQFYAPSITSELLSVASEGSKQSSTTSNNNPKLLYPWSPEVGHVPYFSRVLLPVSLMLLFGLLLWISLSWGPAWVRYMVLLHTIIFALAPLYGGMDQWELSQAQEVFDKSRDK